MRTHVENNVGHCRMADATSLVESTKRSHTVLSVSMGTLFVACVTRWLFLAADERT